MSAWTLGTVTPEERPIIEAVEPLKLKITCPECGASIVVELTTAHLRGDEDLIIKCPNYYDYDKCRSSFYMHDIHLAYLGWIDEP